LNFTTSFQFNHEAATLLFLRINRIIILCCPSPPTYSPPC
jgi:hypothetical protein